MVEIHPKKCWVRGANINLHIRFRPAVVLVATVILILVLINIRQGLRLVVVAVTLVFMGSLLFGVFIFTDLITLEGVNLALVWVLGHILLVGSFLNDWLVQGSCADHVSLGIVNLNWFQPRLGSARDQSGKVQLSECSLLIAAGLAACYWSYGSYMVDLRIRKRSGSLTLWTIMRSVTCTW